MSAVPLVSIDVVPFDPLVTESICSGSSAPAGSESLASTAMVTAWSSLVAAESLTAVGAALVHIDRGRVGAGQPAVVGDAEGDGERARPVQAGGGEGGGAARLAAASGVAAGLAEDAVAVQVPLVDKGGAGLVGVGAGRSRRGRRCRLRRPCTGPPASAVGVALRWRPRTWPRTCLQSPRSLAPERSPRSRRRRRAPSRPLPRQWPHHLRWCRTVGPDFAAIGVVVPDKRIIPPGAGLARQDAAGTYPAT